MKLENHHPDLQTFIRTTKKVSLSYLKTTTTVTTHKNVKLGWVGREVGSGKRFGERKQMIKIY